LYYIDFPDEINLDAPFTVCYSATNLSHEQQELIATMDVGDGFVFTGYKHLNVLLLPFSTARLEYRLWPLKSGPQFLPHFHLFSKPDTSTGVELKELPCTSRPIRIFVRPAPMHVGK
jgi:hypothetical protein